MQSGELRQFSHFDFSKLNRRPFAFQTQIAFRVVDSVSAGNFFSIHPQSDFAIDGTHVVMIPMPVSIRKVLRWKTTVAVGGDRRKRLELLPDSEDVTVRSEPVRLAASFLDHVGVTMVQHLNFDAFR